MSGIGVPGSPADLFPRNCLACYAAGLDCWMPVAGSRKKTCMRCTTAHTQCRPRQQVAGEALDRTLDALAGFPTDPQGQLTGTALLVQVLGELQELRGEIRELRGDNKRLREDNQWLLNIATRGKHADDRLRIFRTYMRRRLGTGRVTDTDVSYELPSSGSGSGSSEDEQEEEDGKEPEKVQEEEDEVVEEEKEKEAGAGRASADPGNSGEDAPAAGEA